MRDPARILIVDDDLVDRMVVRKALEKSGWTGVVEESAGAVEALDKIREKSFDLIVLDYRLPECDGLALFDRIRQLSPTPVVMLTGEGNEIVAVEAMKRGVMDYLPKSTLSPDTLLSTIRQVMERDRQNKNAANEWRIAEHYAFYDPLTDLGNRALFNRDLSRHIEYAKRMNTSFCLMSMDLDRFKKVNDTYGHEAGDEILKEFGAHLLSVGRKGEGFYRTGGDEFSALIEATTPEEVRPLIERIQKIVTRPFTFHSHELSIGVSIGAAFFPLNATTTEELLRKADLAMYQAKRSGSGHFFAS